MSATFTTNIVQDDTVNATGIEVPPEVIAALDAGKKPPVVVRIAGYTYRSTVAVMGGKYMIPLNAAHRQAAGVKGGDAVEITLDLDHEPRTVTAPDDLLAALAAAGLREAFDALSPSKRKEAVRQVEDAKTPETRERRIARIVADLRPA